MRSKRTASLAHVYGVEFQKRGLPHAHILIILQQAYRLLSADDVDSLVCAELPSNPMTFEEGSFERVQARLQDIILQCMVHGPCGPEKPNAPCMKNGVCNKGYPKAFCNVTIWNDNHTYPTYRHRSPLQGGLEIIHNHPTVDNSWIIPYNPYSSIRYEDHINCEVCCSALAAKYLFKYVHKCSNRAMVQVQCAETDGEATASSWNEIKRASRFMFPWLHGGMLGSFLF